MPFTAVSWAVMILFTVVILVVIIPLVTLILVGLFSGKSPGESDHPRQLPCPECGREMPSRVEECPHCGARFC